MITFNQQSGFRNESFYFSFGLIIMLSFSGRAQFDVWLASLEKPSVSNKEKGFYADSLLLHYRKSNPDSALYFARRVLHYAMLDQDTSSVDYALMHLGSLMRIKGDYDSSFYFYNRALESYKAQNYEEGIAAMYNNLATLYKTQGRYDKAIKNYHEALEGFKKTENFNARGNLYSSFAGLYFKLENYQKAYDYWSLAEADFIRDGFSYEITHCYRGHARLYFEWNKLDQAEETLKKAIDLDRQNGIDVFILEDYLLYLELCNRKKEYAQFPSLADSVLYYLKNINNPLNKAIYFEQNGDYFSAIENYPKASESYDSCLVMFRNGHLPEMPEMHLRILKKVFKTDLQLGLLKRTIRLWTEIETLEEQVSELRKDRITQEIDATYDLADKEEKINLLDEKNRAAQEIVLKERQLKEKSEQQVLLLGIGILAFCGFLIYVILTNRKLNRTQKELKKNVEQKEFLFRELNHRVKNNLHIVNSFLGIEMHGKSDEVQEILKVCESRIHSLGLMHEMLYQGDITGQVDLKSYLEKLSAFLSKTLVNENTTITIQSPEEILVSGQKIVLIGLITNELVTNAIKYAKDPQRDLSIQIMVLVSPENLSISVTDNGIGLKEDFNPQKSNSLGMKMAYGLTRQLSGTFSYQNAAPGSSFIFSFKN
ncbi:MAG: tetratricopeptide repeat protein [Crocinitomicaceae bacterium]|nr:tetratricopeptide repeat protein [Crocinitomicaceae bacterium]